MITSLKRAIRAAAEKLPAPWLELLQSADPVIVMYHGVSVDNGPSWLRGQSKHLPLDHFVAQLRALSKLRRVIPLSEMVEGLQSGADLRHAVSITFDDGYKNNITRAAPALDEFRCSATFFLATGYIGADRWMWTDRVERAVAFAADSRKPIAISGQSFATMTCDERIASVVTIKHELKRIALPEAERRLDELEDQIGLPPAPPSGNNEFMQWKDAIELSTAGFEIGAHTVNHPILSGIAIHEAQQEILQSRNQILEHVGRCSPVFCFPNGKRQDYSEEVLAFCRSKFEGALSTVRGPARARDLYELCRIGAPTEGRTRSLLWLRH